MYPSFISHMFVAHMRADSNTTSPHNSNQLGTMVMIGLKPAYLVDTVNRSPQKFIPVTLDTDGSKLGHLKQTPTFSLATCHVIRSVYPSFGEKN